MTLIATISTLDEPMMILSVVDRMGNILLVSTGDRVLTFTGMRYADGRRQIRGDGEVLRYRQGDDYVAH